MDDIDKILLKHIFYALSGFFLGWKIVYPVGDLLLEYIDKFFFYIIHIIIIPNKEIFFLVLIVGLIISLCCYIEMKKK